jgi:hypothetical protein
VQGLVRRGVVRVGKAAADEAVALKFPEYVFGFRRAPSLSPRLEQTILVESYVDMLGGGGDIRADRLHPEWLRNFGKEEGKEGLKGS